MDFSSDGILISLVVGLFGMALFGYGKKQQRLPQLIGGIALMIYPYFVAGVGQMLVVGVAITAAIAVAIGAGY